MSRSARQKEHVIQLERRTAADTQLSVSSELHDCTSITLTILHHSAAIAPSLAFGCFSPYWSIFCAFRSSPWSSAVVGAILALSPRASTVLGMFVVMLIFSTNTTPEHDEEISTRSQICFLDGAKRNWHSARTLWARLGVHVDLGHAPFLDQKTANSVSGSKDLDHLQYTKNASLFLMKLQYSIRKRFLFCTT